MSQPRLDRLIELWRDSDEGTVLSRILAGSELVPDTPADAGAELRQIAARLRSQTQRTELGALLRDAAPSRLNPQQKAEVLALLKPQSKTPT
jgi:hypothetical protein